MKGENVTEAEFIRYYKRRNKSKNYKEAKEKIDLFWNSLLKALVEEEKVSIKNWGTFEKKEVKPRKIVMPTMEAAAITKAKKVIKFKAGTGLRNVVNEVDTDE